MSWQFWQLTGQSPTPHPDPGSVLTVACQIAVSYTPRSRVTMEVSPADPILLFIVEGNDDCGVPDV